MKKSKTKVHKPASNLKQWLSWIGILFIGIAALAVGGIVFLWGALWHHAESPETKRGEFRQAHLVMEDSRVYSYSPDMTYDVEVIYDKAKSKKFHVTANADKAYEIDIPINIDKVKFIVTEKASLSHKPLHTYVKQIYANPQNHAEWLQYNGNVAEGNRFQTTPVPKVINVGNATQVQPSGMAALIAGLSDTGKFVRSVFTDKTNKQILELVDGYTITKIATEVGDDDYKNYDAYAKSHNKEGDLHKYFWHATALGPFKGLESNVKSIEPHVLKDVSSFEVTVGSKQVKGFLIKSDTGNDPTLGVKYGLLLAEDGYSFAGIPINGKTWIKDEGLSSAPANDFRRIYTVILIGTSSAIKDAAQDIASKIGGTN